LKKLINVSLNKQIECVRMDVDVTTNPNWACHAIFNNHGAMERHLKLFLLQY
jgi:hypothetical protein